MSSQEQMQRALRATHSLIAEVLASPTLHLACVRTQPWRNLMHCLDSAITSTSVPAQLSYCARYLHALVPAIPRTHVMGLPESDRVAGFRVEREKDDFRRRLLAGAVTALQAHPEVLTSQGLAKRLEQYKADLAAAETRSRKGPPRRGKADPSQPKLL